MTYTFFVALAAATTLALPAAHAQATYKRDIPDSLAKKAKITEDSAAVLARKRVAKGAIQAVELERENGKLIYSYELKTEGKTGIDEVNVNALTGKIVGVSHETAADEKKEAAEEAKAAKTKKP